MIAWLETPALRSNESAKDCKIKLTTKIKTKTIILHKVYLLLMSTLACPGELAQLTLTS